MRFGKGQLGRAQLRSPSRPSAEELMTCLRLGIARCHLCAGGVKRRPARRTPRATGCPRRPTGWTDQRSPWTKPGLTGGSLAVHALGEATCLGDCEPGQSFRRRSLGGTSGPIHAAIDGRNPARAARTARPFRSRCSAGQSPPSEPATASPAERPREGSRETDKSPPPRLPDSPTGVAGYRNAPRMGQRSRSCAVSP